MENRQKQQNPLVIVAGPTASGKTAVSVQLSKIIGGEIISADSMQVYLGMDIGSAKIRPEEMQGVRHHLIDVLEPEEAFDVVRFQQMAKEAISDIRSRGRIPILAGGTGFYIQAVLYDIDFTETAADYTYRKELAEIADREGAETLHRILAQCDPASAQAIHANNVKRVIRALEFYHETGKRISEHNAEQKSKKSPYTFCYFVLDRDRGALYRRIDSRVDQMLADGLLAEVRALRDRGLTADMVSMQGLGYKEMLAYLNGESTYEEAVSILKRDTRHFAKRQLTWFHHTADVIRMEPERYGDDCEKLALAMAEICRQHGIGSDR